MKKLIYILLFLSGFTWAQTPTIDSDFKNANTLYQQENYEDAVAHYLKLIKEGKESAEVHFNLGNAYYKLHQTAPSIYHYEKALLLNPDDIATQTNLKFAQKTLLDDIPTVRNLGSKEILHNFFKGLSSDSWAWLSVGAAVLILFCYIGYFLIDNSSLKRLFFGLMTLFALSAIFTTAAAYLEQAYVKSKRAGILFAEKTELKTEAKNSSKTLATLHQGTKLYILEEKSLWAKVKLNNQNTGWVLRESFKEIK